MKSFLGWFSFGGGVLVALIMRGPTNDWLGLPADSWIAPIGVFVVVSIGLNVITQPFAAASDTGFSTSPFGRRLGGFIARPLTYILTFGLLLMPFALVPGPLRFELLHKLPLWLANGLVAAYLLAMVWLATKLVMPVREWVAILTTPVRRFLRIISFGAGGSAKFAGIMDEWCFRYKKGSVLLGSSFYDPNWRVGLKDDRHILTVGGTRAGKNRSLLIPNLLAWPGSAIVIDPKGTNAAVTAARRGHGGGNVTESLGQDVYVLDPFGEVPGVTSARFNPLDFINPDSIKVVEDIGLVADALVVPSGDKFFDNSARGLIAGLIAHVVTREREQGQANLRRVRELLARGDKDQWEDLLTDMLGNHEAGGLAAGAASQMKTAALETSGSIMATTLEQTSWLDSMAMAEILNSSDFALSDLKAKLVTVYLVLPPDQLRNHACFLRLFVNLAIQIASTGANPRYPVLFILDEFFSLGKLDLAENAVSLLGSKSLKFWPVVQSLTQLKKLYGENWEAFWDAAAVVQIFGIGDRFTEDYTVDRLGLHKVRTTRRGRDGQEEVIEQIHKLRQPEELEFEVAREAGSQLVWRKGADAMFLRRLNYDQAFPAHWYNPDPDFVKAKPATMPPNPPEAVPPKPPEAKPRSPAKPPPEPWVPLEPVLGPDGKPRIKQTVQPRKPAKKKAPAAPVKRAIPLERDPFEELDSLIGLEAVKEEIRNVATLVRFQKEREDAGLTVAEVSYHLVFTGNPGTGKTTVARIVGRIYKQLGVLRTGQLIETDRAGLVGQYTGQTAPKVQEIVNRALNGVLFIDEAYSLITEHAGQDFGPEALATLLKMMEDNRKRLAVIVAGYTKEMDTFIGHNPGLRSRFKKFIEFPDYGPEELLEILISICTENSYTLTPDALNRAKELLQQLHENRGSDFGNGRTVRNLFEECISRQAGRLADVEEYSTTDLMILHEEDIPPYSDLQGLRH